MLSLELLLMLVDCNVNVGPWGGAARRRRQGATLSPSPSASSSRCTSTATSLHPTSRDYALKLIFILSGELPSPAEEGAVARQCGGRPTRSTTGRGGSCWPSREAAAAAAAEDDDRELLSWSEVKLDDLDAEDLQVDAALAELIAEVDAEAEKEGGQKDPLGIARTLPSSTAQSKGDVPTSAKIGKAAAKKMQILWKQMTRGATNAPAQSTTSLNSATSASSSTALSVSPPPLTGGGGSGGGGGGVHLMEQVMAQGSTSTDREDFNPILFLSQVHSPSSLESLQRGLLHLQKSVNNRAAAMKSLVAEHFGQYVFCLTGDHRVLTRRGWSSITRVQVGEEVMSFNTVTYEGEWKAVTRVTSHEVDRRDEADTLYRMQGRGMDVIATRDHRMLLARTTSNADLQGTVVMEYSTVDALLSLTSKVARSPQLEGRAVVTAGINRQPAVRVVIPGLERLCDCWWEKDEQRGFLRFLGCWLGDGFLHTQLGYVGIRIALKQQRAIDWLEPLLNEVFPRWWLCHEDAMGCRRYSVRCPPLYEFLRLKAVGPPGFNPCDPVQLRAYPHFTKDAELSAKEMASHYYAANSPPCSVTTRTEAAMLAALTTASECCWWCHAVDREEGDAMVMCSGGGCHCVGHLLCANLTAIPEGDWLCPSCSPVAEAQVEGLAAKWMEGVERVEMGEGLQLNSALQGPAVINGHWFSPQALAGRSLSDCRRVQPTQQAAGHRSTGRLLSGRRRVEESRV